jgi:hypothetical protein
MTPRASSRTLTDLEEIRRWAEERRAWPARVRKTGDREDVGVIRLAFSAYSRTGSLEGISWDEWFEKFEDNNLALIVQNKTARGRKSNFNKIVGRDTLEERARTGRRAGRHARAAGTAARKRTSARRPSAARSSRTARSKRATPARGSRSGSRRSRTRVVSISSRRSTRAQARTSRKRTSARRGQSLRRAA